MSVSDMRRCLSEVRALLAEQNMKRPFNMKHELSNGMELWNFVHKVAIGLYQKRSRNRKKSRVDDVDGDVSDEE